MQGKAPLVAINNNSVTVTAGIYDLNATPVAVDWEGAIPTCMESNGELIATQQEEAEDGRSLLWIMAEASAGESREYIPSERADCSSSTFEWEAVSSDVSRLLIDDLPAVEYVHPVFDSKRARETMKPFHHVYAPDGSRLITKGVGGNHSHHRGIFYGYNDINFGDKNVSTWGSGPRSNEHARLSSEWSGPVFGGHEVVIDWVDEDGEDFAEEARKLRVYRRPGGEMVIDVESELTSKVGPVELGGDHHHGGLQFRAAQYVYDHSDLSQFLRPEEWSDFPVNEEMNDEEWFKDVSWNAFQFVVDGEPYTVGYFSHPQNPQGGQMSERLYGRFGEFVPGQVIDEGESLTLRYRFLISSGHEVDRERMKKEYSAYTVGS